MLQTETLTRKPAARRRAYRLCGLALILLAFALALPAGALASLSGDRDGATLPGFTPPLLRASGILSGHVYDFDGSPLNGAGVCGFVTNAADENIWDNRTNTDAQGSFSFSDAPATTQGRLLVSPNTTDTWYTKYLTFADPGPTVFDVRPGRFNWTATRGGPLAATWSDAAIDVVGTTAGPVVTYASTLKTGVGAASAVQGWASALPGNVTYVVFSFSAGEAAIWDAADPGNAPFPVTAGAVSATQLSFNEASARRLSYEGPYWASGAPGTTVTLGFENYPQGEQAAMEGYSVNGAEASLTTWNHRTFTSTGPSKQTIELAIPAGAVPGLDYMLGAKGTEAIANTFIFSLTQSFQVCTLKSAPAAVKKGATVKLSGVVPVQGNLEGKKVTVYARTTVATAVPPVWDAAKAGWKQVATLKTDARGKFLSGKLKPAKTTWYVVRYGGDDYHRRAYTSVIKVTVK